MDTPFDERALDELLAALEPGEVPIDSMPDLMTDTPTAEEQAPRPETIDGIWTRQPEETARAYECFCAYRHLGPGRTLLAAYQQKTGKKTAKQSSGHWNGWYGHHEWKLRAESYDARLDEQKRQAEAQKWRERGEKLVEEQFALAEAMLEKTLQMLQFPLVRQVVEQTGEDGKPTHVTVEPARWTFNSVARLAKVAVELGRLAAGLPTKNEQSVHFEIDPSQLTDEQIERILAGEHPAAVIAAPSKGDPVHRQP